MLSKTAQAALTIAAVITFGCTLPWSPERGNEVNLTVRIENNEMLVDATLGGRPGRFIVGSAQPLTIIDRAFTLPQRRPVQVKLGGRFSTSVTPVVEDLDGIADGILGADVWRDSTLVIDYRRQMVIVSSDPADRMNGPLYRFDGPPVVPVTVDGRQDVAILDSALPDTIVLPAGDSEVASRRSIRLRIGDHDLGAVDARFGNTTGIRVGSRLLARFLVKIDYRRRMVSLWLDPRRGWYTPRAIRPNQKNRGED